MAGHSHWKQIKHQKEATDQEKSRLVSKFLNAIAAAAKEEPNPQFNPHLRTAIERARAANVPQINIKKAIAGSRVAKERSEEILIEAYGPGGCALLIVAVTHNKNRTIQQIKALLREKDLKLAPPGGVLWNFKKNPEKPTGWLASFKKGISAEAKNNLQELIQELDKLQEIRGIYTDVQ